ncbi:hypothetical protein AB9M62_25440 [Bacillales bacterium AN1005]
MLDPDEVSFWEIHEAIMESTLGIVAYDQFKSSPAGKLIATNIEKAATYKAV